MQPLSGNQRPDLLTSLMNMSLLLRLPRKMHLCRSSSMSHACHRFWTCHTTLTFLLTFDKVHNPLRLPRETTSGPPKVVRTPGVFNILTSKCASRHNGVHFFDISTSKSGPEVVCLVHFDFEMCFAPQRRALFRHRNFQKWSGGGVSCTFWLRNVLRATTACTFSTSQLPKVVRTCGVFNILTSKCASRHNGVHFFDISTSKSGPEVVCLVHFDFEMCFAPQRRALFRHLNFQKWSGGGVSCTFWLRNVLRATTACTFSTSQLPKVVRRWCVLYILTSKCASRHNGVHFFDISTSKSGREVVCLVHFDFEMCFAPQRRALFRHRNFQKWSRGGVSYTFWLRNVLRATTACTFSTSQLPKVVRTWGVFSFFTCKCASRHNGVRFFISHLARWLRTRRFSEPTFRPSGATNHWKNTVFRDFPTFFAHLHLLSSDSFFWLFLFSDLLFSSPLPSSPLLSSPLLSSLLFSSLLFSSLRFASLRFASLRFSSLLFSSLPFPSLRFASLRFASLLCSALLCSSLLFSSLTLTTSAFHPSILSDIWLLNFLRQCICISWTLFAFFNWFLALFHVPFWAWTHSGISGVRRWRIWVVSPCRRRPWRPGTL